MLKTIEILGSHRETIKCPSCNSLQSAKVEYTAIWNMYVHECSHCKYMITESEWCKVDLLPQSPVAQK